MYIAIISFGVFCVNFFWRRRGEVFLSGVKRKNAPVSGRVIRLKTGAFREGVMRFLRPSLQFLYQFAELFGKLVHGSLEAGEQVEGDDDGKADGRDGGKYGLFHTGLPSGQASSRSLAS